MDNQRFELRLTPSSAKDYERLDSSVRKIVNKKLADLEERADEIGKILSGKLTGCREIKLRDAGIRIVYRITGEKINILTLVDIITIHKRETEEVFKIAEKRMENPVGNIRWPKNKK